MELSRENFRAMIFYDFKQNLSQKECVDRLNLAFGDEAPSKATVYNWYAEFRRGRNFLRDEIREGRPPTSVVAFNVDAVRKMIEQDPHVTYREIKSSLGIDMTSIRTILRDHLRVRKLCSRWIPAETTEKGTETGKDKNEEKEEREEDSKSDHGDTDPTDPTAVPKKRKKTS